MKLSGTHQLLAYADGVKLLEDNIDTMKNNKGTFIDDDKKGLERNKLRDRICFCLVNRMHIKIGM
jgi:hypothetical protein